MLYRRHQDMTLSEIGIGCYALSGAYGSKDIAEFKQMTHRAFELGVNFFDTAEAYGDAEQILGEVIKPYRERVYLATKVGGKEGARANLSRDYIRSACEKSLQALQTDYVDLYQIHFDDPETPVEETVSALEALVSAGKIRHYGLGHLSLSKVEEYFIKGNIFSMLMELHALARTSHTSLLPACRKHNVAAIAFSVTGRGLLTGKYNEGVVFDQGDIRNFDPLFQRERFQSGLRVAGRLAELGENYAKTPAQVAIAWVLSQPGVFCALTGPSTIAHLEENLGGSGWRPDQGDLDALETFLKEEENRLAPTQTASIWKILAEPLPEDNTQALKDLVYTIETALELGLAVESEIIPVYMELFEVYKAPDQETGPQLASIQSRVRDKIKIVENG